MKRKRTPDAAEPVSEPVVPEAIVEQARRAIEADREKPAHCVVCGGDCAGIDFHTVSHVGSLRGRSAKLSAH